MLSEKRITEQLNKAGYRITQPRRAVIRALLEDAGYSSPAMVHKGARRYCPTVGLVTVYRTLDLLSQLGFVRRIHSEDGCRGYAIANHGHMQPGQKFTLTVRGERDLSRVSRIPDGVGDQIASGHGQALPHRCVRNHGENILPVRVAIEVPYEGVDSLSADVCEVIK